MRNHFIASAVALALSAPTAIALAQQQGVQQPTQQQQRNQQQQPPMQQQSRPPGGQWQAAMQEFQRADRNRDGYVSMQEAKEGALPKMDQQKFQQADLDNDGHLSQQEFRTAMQGSDQPPTQARQQGESGQRGIVVQQEPAQIVVQQKPPEVTVQQHQPDVTITQPEPNVQISQPEPNVRIEQAEADVTVQQQGEPQVQIEQSEPAEVGVVRPEDRQQQQAGRQMETGGTEGLWSMRAGELEGKQVVNAQGDEIGEVENLARGADNEVYAIVAVGGFWGIGERNVPIALTDLNLQDDQLALTTNRSEEEIKQQAGSQRMENYQALDENQSLAEYAGGREAGVGGMTASFHELDKNQDGYVTPQEASDSQTLTDQWGQADRNNDGRVDRSEFSAFETKVK